MNDKKRKTAEFNRNYELSKLVSLESFLKYEDKPEEKEVFKHTLERLYLRLKIILKTPVSLLAKQLFIKIVTHIKI